MKFANGMSHNSMCVQTICKTNFHEIKSIFMFTRQILVLLPSSKSDYKWIFVSFFFWFFAIRFWIRHCWFPFNPNTKLICTSRLSTTTFLFAICTNIYFVTLFISFLLRFFSISNKEKNTFFPFKRHNEYWSRYTGEAFRFNNEKKRFAKANHM